MAKLACLGPFWVLILGLAPGISGISEWSEAVITHLEYDWVKSALNLGSVSPYNPRSGTSLWRGL